MRKTLAAVALSILGGAAQPVLAQGAVQLDDETDAPAWLSERRIIGTNDLEPIGKVQGTSLYDFSRIVARVETRTGSGFCTGSRLAPDLFLTNYHCFQVAPCNNLQFHMGYEKGVPPASQSTFACKEVLAKNLTLDYALYRVTTAKEAFDDGDGSPEAVRAERLFPSATLWTGALRVGQPLMVASHPAARLKEIDRSANCTLRTATWEVSSERKTLTHNCDTEGGSSGSPVLDRATGSVVALHWGGATDFNFAIPMNLIVEDLRGALAAADFSKLALRR